jgi:hypothetical protein
MIRFESGSGRYQGDAQLYHFKAVDDHEGEILGLISPFAVEDLTGDAFDPSRPMAMFERHEKTIFELAESVFVLRGLKVRGVLAVSSDDTLMRLAL